MSLDMIENKLLQYQYPDMERLESDLKRLVQNAKEYNSTKSEVYEDAERIRKALSNFMPRHNPAYLNPNYRAYPTPLPHEQIKGYIPMAVQPVQYTNGTTMHNDEEQRPEVSRSTDRRRQSQAPSTTTADQDAEAEDDEDLADAQVDILEQIIALPNAENFYEKPPRRDYPDYYRIISKPTALMPLQKLAKRGELGTWPEFIEEVRLIWANAKEFNEEGSEIYGMAEEFEKWFENHIVEKGINVPKTKLKLSMPDPSQRLTVKFTRPGSKSTPPIEIDNEALRRQNEDLNRAAAASRNNIRAAVAPVNGYRPSTPSSLSNGGLKRSVSIVNLSRSQAAISQDKMEVDELAPTPAQKSSTTQAPALPTQPLRTVPQAALPVQQAVAYSIHDSPSPFDRIFRDNGKGISDALFSSVTVMTSPIMRNDPKFHTELWASGTMTQTTDIRYLPHTHQVLRIMPRITKECLARPKYKVVVCRNWEVIPPLGDRQHTWDIRLFPGNNNIVVDIVAELRPGEHKSYAAPQLQIDFERKSVNAWLLDEGQEVQ